MLCRGCVVAEIFFKDSPKLSAALDPVCKLPKKPGRCLAYMPRYYYNTTTGTCQRFIYGGCEGNENNFETLKQCQAKCAPALPNPVCNETKYRGPCLGYFPRYYFNNVSKTCEKFVYGGCRGNGNNFHTLEECQNTCWVSLDQDAAETVDAAELTLWPFSPPEQCTYAADPGPCTAYMPRFFYNTLSKTCEMFVYGGCGGNSNNFHTYDACQKTCKKFFGVIPRA
ncbi:hypothetical protein HPB50_019824 [Hyalomma asiaticum]|uniref:Uncharacterized protein n=1 Tax=Hyalomma asiaticum TaxID=266040 RepID=A0ACB7RYU9_HYAAI|nr:hypothetical protein HPB50_019824 [Hyalomma asiaticum]